jgi:hypothetical protein
MLRSSVAAARNNAEWCEILCATHGVQGRFDADAWTSRRRTPRRYPDAVTLRAGASPAAILAWIDTATSGASVKDSFSDLDLAPHGFTMLFEAEWILRDADRRSPDPTPLAWSIVDDAHALAAWESARDDGTPVEPLRSALLLHHAVSVLAGSIDGQVVAGAIANTSKDVVGLSNVFSARGRDEAWAGCVDAVTRAVPGLPIVGYESGGALTAARREGFASVGPLRVWVAA